ncbi:MAG TPA: TonB-dependent receptor [Vicinamibacterales bacterium]|nr:TonB-dependent receptor [Vicinamibacterales bacterium]
MPRSVRLPVLTILFALVVHLGPAARPARAQSASPPDLALVVVDSQGAAVVRAYVRLVDRSGRTIRTTLTDAEGRARIDGGCAACQLEVSLAGFRTASMPATAGRTVRVVLSPAPVTESIVVSATRGEAPTGQVGASTTVFDRQAIERRGSPLVSQLLRSTPGAIVVHTGGLGGVTSLFVRGGESDYNAVLLDGMPINEPGGTFNFGNLTTTDLERIEIVRGAQSALFGTDAMSGVVQLFTRRAPLGDARPRVSATLEGGSLATTRATAGVSWTAGRLDYSVTGALFGTDNASDNHRFENATAAWNVGASLDERTSIRVTGRLERQEAGTPGATAFGPPDLDARFERDDASVGATLLRRSATLTHRVMYAFTTSVTTSTNLLADPPFVAEFEGRQALFDTTDFLFHSQNDLSRHRLSYQADWQVPAARAGAQIVTALVDYDAERGAFEDRLADSALRGSRDNVGVAVQHQWIAGRTSVTSGLRVEQNESFGTAVAPRLSILQTLRTGTGTLGRTAVRFNAGRGVKAPSLLESFSPNFFFQGNADLEAERARTIDVGIEQRLADDRVRVELTWFDNRFRDQITVETIDFSTFEGRFVNVDRSRSRGIELAVDAVPAGWLELRAGYTRLDTCRETSTADCSGFADTLRLVRRPKHSGFVDVTTRTGQATLGLSGVIIGDRRDTSVAFFDPALPEQSYAVWALLAEYAVRTGVDAFLRVENLTDRTYMEPLGYQAWGRTVHAGLRVRF